MVVILKSVAGFGNKSLRWSAKAIWAAVAAAALLVWAERKESWFLPIVTTVLAVLVTSHFTTFGLLALVTAGALVIKVKALLTIRCAVKLGLGLWAFSTFVAMTSVGTIGMILAIAGLVAGHQLTKVPGAVKALFNAKRKK